MDQLVQRHATHAQRTMRKSDDDEFDRDKNGDGDGSGGDEGGNHERSRSQWDALPNEVVLMILHLVVPAPSSLVHRGHAKRDMLERRVCISVCWKWHDLLAPADSPYCRSCNRSLVGYHMMEAAAREGSIQLLKWLSRNGCRLCIGVCNAAAEEGHFELLKWAIESGCSWGLKVGLNAARRGDLAMLRWVTDRGCAFDGRICSRAAAGGHLEVLQGPGRMDSRGTPTSASAPRKGATRKSWSGRWSRGAPGTDGCVMEPRWVANSRRSNGREPTVVHGTAASATWLQRGGIWNC